MKPIPETNSTDWTPQIWPGNPSLNLTCSCKYFSNPFGGKKIPVFIFGGTKEYPGFNFCVSAGAKSDLSYTGRAEGYELRTAQKFVDDLHYSSKLIK